MSWPFDVLAIVLVAAVLPLALIGHYVTEWRKTKMLSGEDEKLLSELWESASRMESRVNALERILDTETPSWRKKT